MEPVTNCMLTINESLVDFAKVRRQKSEAVAARILVDDAWALVAIDERARKVTFENHVGADERVVGNPDRLVQVFVNLLRNALTAVEAPGGHIDVRARRQDRAGTPGLAMAVEDNGPGIPPGVLPNVFDAFGTA